jgi:hypothetical protein
MDLHYFGVRILMDLHYFVIRIRSTPVVKSWIKIRIKVNSWFRIRIKVEIEEHGGSK